MLWIFAALAVVALIWVALEFKTSRPDGQLARVHPYRRMMPIIMPGRNESVVYFEHTIDATALLEYVQKHGPEMGCTISHLTVAAVAAGLHAHPKLNRFVAGQRVYDRRGVWLSFSMKRQKLSAESKIAVVKLEVPEDMTLAGLCEAVHAKVNRERSNEETYLDKELSLFLRLPHALLKRAARVLFWANDHNLLPASFIREDSMFTSVTIANLGSLGMDPGFHHLYEWGTCSTFMMVGQLVEREVTLPDGTSALRMGLPMRFSYDERVEDGLSAGRALKEIAGMLENPEAIFGPNGLCALGASTHLGEDQQRPS